MSNFARLRTDSEWRSVFPDGIVPIIENPHLAEKGKIMGKPKQESFDISGPGVAPVRHKDLDKLGDQLSDLRTDKSELAEKITTVETKALERMTELGLERYRFRDREMSIKAGSAHVKIKEVKVGSNGNGADEGEDEP